MSRVGDPNEDFHPGRKPMNLRRDMVATAAKRAREALLARKALCAATMLHSTPLLIVLICTIIPIHAGYG